MFDLGFDTPDFAELDSGNWLDEHPLNVGRLFWLLALPNAQGASWFDLVGGVPGVLTSFSSGYGPNPFSNPSGFGSLKFDGSSAYVNAGAAPNVTPTQITVCAWVQLTSTLSAIKGVVARDRSTAPSGWLLGANSSTRAPRWMVSTNTNLTLSGSSGLAVGTWYRLVGTFDGATSRLYVNGAQVASGALSGSLFTVTAQNLVIGNDPAAAGRFWPGYINDVSISSFAWPATLVALDYALSQQGYPGVLRRRRRLGVSVASTTLPGIAAAAGQGAASLSGTVTLAATAQVQGAGNASASGSLALAATVRAKGSLSATLAGGFSQTATASAKGQASASAAPTLSLAAKASAAGTGAATFAGTVSNNLFGTARASGQGAASLSGSVKLATQAQAAGVASAVSTPKLSLAATAQVRGTGAVTLVGTVAQQLMAVAQAQGQGQVLVLASVSNPGAARANAAGVAVATLACVVVPQLYPDIIFTEPARPLVFTEPARPLYFSSA